MDWVIDFVIIFGACMLADIIMSGIREWQDRRLDIGCDYCEEARRTYKTPDRKYWLCRNCIEVYMEERDFPMEAREKVRKKFKVKNEKRN